MVGGVLAMGLSVMMFAFMPFLDRSRIPGGAHFRPIYRVQFYLFLLDMLVLGYVGYVPPTSSTLLIGQVATLCYFGSFFLIPFISQGGGALAGQARLAGRGHGTDGERGARHRRTQTRTASPQRRQDMSALLKLVLLCCFSVSAWANEAPLEKIRIATDVPALERGADALMNCLP